ncbi:MAG: sensor histidine kinase [Deltaproteobacteria bacterium]|nr:sensor histidine kinase [Deltaproteobacteria bacterium]
MCDDDRDNAIQCNVENGQIKFVAAQKNNGIFVSVYNTGPGVAEDDLGNVFEQFYRVEKSRSLQYGGAGLGLAVVRKIVQLHGGTVKMESEEGVWARITIWLPLNTLIS